MLNSSISVCSALTADSYKSPSAAIKLTQSKVERRARHFQYCCNVTPSISEVQNIKAYWEKTDQITQAQTINQEISNMKKIQLWLASSLSNLLFHILASHKSLRKHALQNHQRNGYCTFLTSAVTSFVNCSWQKTGKHSKNCLQM